MDKVNITKFINIKNGKLFIYDGKEYKKFNEKEYNAIDINNYQKLIFGNSQEILQIKK